MSHPNASNDNHASTDTNAVPTVQVHTHNGISTSSNTDHATTTATVTTPTPHAGNDTLKPLAVDTAASTSTSTSTAVASSATPISRVSTVSNKKATISSGRPSTATEIEVEGEIEKDPYQLRDRLLSEEQLAGLRSRFGRKGTWLGMGLVARVGTRKGRALEEYHVKQNQLIPELLKPIDAHTADAEESDNAARLPVKIAVHASLWANIILCILQAYAAIASLSLSLISTGIDSIFDVGSNASLFYLHRQAVKMRKDEKKWPVGGARLECIGNIVFGSLMCAVNLIVIVESVRALATKEGDALHTFHLPSIVAVSVALAIKIALFLYSYGLRNKSSQVQVLWEDHRNDLFLNSFAIITSTGGSKIVWWLDPAGAIVLGLFIIISWSRTIYGEFSQLAGKSAPHEFLQLLTYKAATFSDAIERVDTVRAYHSGPNYFVEVDIVMDGANTLYTAHDLSQSLQDKLEALPDVERAFVHVDYETDHTPEHRKRKLA